jgi:HD-GYP domain-containing protein (c-di-GMP phosphodiesterase class II)
VELGEIETQALALLQTDPDEGLFVLFQALDDVSRGYCATHALLAAVVCALTADQLGLAPASRQALFRAALLMNLGMAQAQDQLAQQSALPNDAQRKLIKEHPEKSLALLQAFGLHDPDTLDLVRWHHDSDAPGALPHNQALRRLLHCADNFVAKMAPRKTRLAMSPLGAASALSHNAATDTAALVSAIAQSVGFYPPGTFVQLVSGEKAVAVARGQHANAPHVMSVVGADGLPLRPYRYLDTSQPHCAVRTPLNAEKIKVTVSLDDVAQVLQQRRAKPA